MCWRSRFLFYTKRKCIRKVCFPCQLELIRASERWWAYVLNHALCRHRVWFLLLSLLLFLRETSPLRECSALLSRLPFMKLWPLVLYIKLQDSSLPLLSHSSPKQSRVMAVPWVCGRALKVCVLFYPNCCSCLNNKATNSVAYKQQKSLSQGSGSEKSKREAQRDCPLVRAGFLVY